jgi:Glycosyl transferase family 2
VPIERLPVGDASDRLARAVELVSRYARGGVVVDLGCTHNGAADLLSESRFSYLAAGTDKGVLDDLRARGHEAHDLDVTHVERLAEALVDLADGRRVGAVMLVDVIDRHPDVDGFLAGLREGLVELGHPVLVTSVANVAHLDLGAKLVTGRWDPGLSGLLERTSYRYYTESLLTDELERHGWRQLDRADVAATASDQHFPSDHPGLASSTPLHQFLARVRGAADPNGSVTHFVRAYALTDAPERSELLPPELPFLSVVVTTDGESPARLSELLTCLAAQSREDLEVVVVVDSPDQLRLGEVSTMVGSYSPEFSERVAIVASESGGAVASRNQGIDLARGEYLAFPEVGDLLASDWAETFAKAAVRDPGRVVRAPTLSRFTEPTAPQLGGPPYETLSRPFPEHPDRFDLVAHLGEDLTPPRSVAFPRGLCQHLSLRFDETLPALTEWDFLLRAVLLAGVSDAATATSLGDRRDDGSDADEGGRAFVRRLVLSRLDDGPSILPAGLLTGVAAASTESITAEARLLREQGAESLRAEVAHTRSLVTRMLEESRSQVEASVARAASAVTEARRQLAEAQAFVNGARTELTEARLETERTRWEAERLRRQRDEVLASRSWRMGRPFRWLGRGLRGRSRRSTR